MLTRVGLSQIARFSLRFGIGNVDVEGHALTQRDLVQQHGDDELGRHNGLTCPDEANPAFQTHRAGICRVLSSVSFFQKPLLREWAEEGGDAVRFELYAHRGAP